LASGRPGLIANVIENSKRNETWHLCNWRLTRHLPRSAPTQINRETERKKTEKKKVSNEKTSRFSAQAGTQVTIQTTTENNPRATREVLLRIFTIAFRGSKFGTSSVAC